MCAHFIAVQRERVLTAVFSYLLWHLEWTNVFFLCFVYGMATQEIVRANEQVKIAAELVTKYRKNVQYNLEATRGGRRRTRRMRRERAEKWCGLCLFHLWGIRSLACMAAVSGW